MSQHAVRAAAAQRGDAAVAYLFGETVGPLNALRKFLNADQDACSSEVARWASHVLRDRIGELRQMTEEIDADYASEP